MELFLIERKEVEEIGSYLMGRPYAEVEKFIPILRNLKPFIQVEDNKIPINRNNSDKKPVKQKGD